MATCSVRSPRLKRRRFEYFWSVATCLNDWINSAAWLRLVTSCDDASRLISRNSFRLDRLRLPCANSAANMAILLSSVEATVRLVPTGLLISCATPATSRPSAASFSASISEVLGLPQISQCRFGCILGAAYLSFAFLQRGLGALALGNLFRGDVDADNFTARAA